MSNATSTPVGCDELTMLMEEFERLDLLADGKLRKLVSARSLDELRGDEERSRFVPPPDGQWSDEIRGKRSQREALSRELRARIHMLRTECAPSALCLSGGGIRSATFSLGVLQGLARKGLLDKFHYLSTVSGGGYIGSWLSTWIRRDGSDPVIAALAQPEATEPAPVRRLRAYSNYLSPVVGLSGDFLTLIATFVRNLLLNWLILLPALIALLMLPRLYVAMTKEPLTLNSQGPFGIDAIWTLGSLGLAGAVCLVVSIAYISSDLPGPPETSPPSRNKFVSWCLVPLVFATMIVSWLGASLLTSKLPSLLTSPWTYGGAGAILHGLGAVIGYRWRTIRQIAPWPPRPARERLKDWALVILSGAVGGWLLFKAVSQFQHVSTLTGDALLWYSTLAVPVLLAVYWASMTLYAGLSRRLSDEDEREWWARASGAIMAVAVAWILLFAFVYFAPRWLLSLPWLNSHKGTALAAGGVLSVIVATIGYWSKNGPAIRQRVNSVASALGLRLLDIAALAAIVVLLLSMTVLPSWLYAQYHVDRVEELADMRFSHGRTATTFLTNCQTPSTPSVKSQIACARAAAAAKELLAYSTWKNAAAQATTACKEAADPAAIQKDLVDPVNEASAAYSRDADARQRCTSLTKLAAESVYGPSGAGWLRLKHDAALLTSGPVVLATSILILAGIAFIVAVATGTNAFSLHAMYGNRLVRAYLGATRDTGLGNINPPRKPHWFTGFDRDDSLPMALADDTTISNDPPPRLFHIINAALNIVRPAGDRLEWQERKAVSFTMTPLHCGTPRQGYAPSRKYSGADGMTYARAMTISGAAAAPNMGYHSSPLVTFLMALFNARLGWWLPNTASTFQSAWPRSEPRPGSFAHFAEMFGRTMDDSEFVYVSDGGHFENLGLYEMVRRRCRRILVVDAGCDPKYEYGDLTNAIRRIRIDFGIDIEFLDPLPRPWDATESTKANGCHVARGCIRYSRVDAAASKDGQIILIKPVLTGDEPLDVKGYSAASASRSSRFPQQPTSDQFFDESQFESYRTLGVHSVTRENAQLLDWDSWSCSDAATRPFSDGLPVSRAGGVADPPPTLGAETMEGPGSIARSAGTISSTLMDSVRAINPAALVASTLAVGGLAGVTGTVALRDSTLALNSNEIRLSEADRRLAGTLIDALKEGNSQSNLRLFLFEVPQLFGAFPILFEAAGTKSDYWKETYLVQPPQVRVNPASTDVWDKKSVSSETDGVSLTGDAKDAIKQLMSELQSCADESSPQRPLTLDVIGFASSQDFCRTDDAIADGGKNTVSRDTLNRLAKCEPSVKDKQGNRLAKREPSVKDKQGGRQAVITRAHRQSDLLNVMTANRRAMVVYDYLSTEFADNTVTIRAPTIHTTFDSMVNERKYIDEIVGGRLEYAEDITRRAEIRIVSAPGCPGISALAAKAAPAGSTVATTQ